MVPMTGRTQQLDRVFHALADPTRRAVLARLSRGAAPVSELAQPFEMALPSFLQHLKVLEASGLVSSAKSGRVRTYTANQAALAKAEHWLAARLREWESRFDRLDAYLMTMKGEDE